MLFGYLRQLLLGLLAAGLISPVWASPSDQRDPWEDWNRKVFWFNETADQYVVRPVAKTYKDWTPKLIDDGITNFFDNLGSVVQVSNDLLQGRWSQAGKDSTRFLLNTTVGVLGFFDVADYIGLTSEPEDFGQSLAVWGVESGPYLMLPLLGSSTVRDAGGRVFDSWISPMNWAEDGATRLGMNSLDLLDTRGDLLNTEGLLSGDRYSFLRELYFQRRAYLIGEAEGEGFGEGGFGQEPFDDGFGGDGFGGDGF